MERIGIGTAPPAFGDVLPGREGAPLGAAIVIGVSRYGDAKLTSCPAAARTADAIGRALAPCLSGGVTRAIDPSGTMPLLMALQAAAARARGGVLVLYFAGITIRNGDELLLTTCASTLGDKAGCIPWSDVDDILQRERVQSGLAILNAEGFAGVGWLGSKAPHVRGMGSVRIHDPLTAEARIATYGDAVADALSAPARDLRPHLSNGVLDVAALERFLRARAPTPDGYDPLHPKRGEAPRHETFGAPAESDVVLRDLREELARAPAPSAAIALASPTTPTAGGARAKIAAAAALLLVIAGLVAWLVASH